MLERDQVRTRCQRAILSPRNEPAIASSFAERLDRARPWLLPAAKPANRAA